MSPLQARGRDEAARTDLRALLALIRSHAHVQNQEVFCHRMLLAAALTLTSLNEESGNTELIESWAAELDAFDRRLGVIWGGAPLWPSRAYTGVPRS